MSCVGPPRPGGSGGSPGCRPAVAWRVKACGDVLRRRPGSRTAGRRGPRPGGGAGRGRPRAVTSPSRAGAAGRRSRRRRAGRPGQADQRGAQAQADPVAGAGRRRAAGEPGAGCRSRHRPRPVTEPPAAGRSRRPRPRPTGGRHPGRAGRAPGAWRCRRETARWGRLPSVSSTNEARLPDAGLDEDPHAVVVEPLGQLAEPHGLHQVLDGQLADGVGVVGVAVAGRGRPQRRGGALQGHAVPEGAQAVDVGHERRRVEARAERQLLGHDLALGEAALGHRHAAAAGPHTTDWCGQLSWETAMPSRSAMTSAATSAPQPSARYTTSGTSNAPGRRPSRKPSAPSAGISSAGYQPVHSPTLWPAMSSGRTPRSPSTSSSSRPADEDLAALRLERRASPRASRAPGAPEPAGPPASRSASNVGLDAREQERHPAAGGDQALGLRPTRRCRPRQAVPLASARAASFEPLVVRGRRWPGGPARRPAGGAGGRLAGAEASSGRRQLGGEVGRRRRRPGAAPRSRNRRLAAVRPWPVTGRDASPT